MIIQELKTQTQPDTNEILIEISQELHKHNEIMEKQNEILEKIRGVLFNYL